MKNWDFRDGGWDGMGWDGNGGEKGGRGLGFQFGEFVCFVFFVHTNDVCVFVWKSLEETIVQLHNWTY